jgi:hypothetical protein
LDWSWTNRRYIWQLSPWLRNMWVRRLISVALR